MKTPTASLQIKNGKYYVVMNLYDNNGKRKIKWISTGYEVKGNKRLATARMNELIIEYTNEQVVNEALQNCGKTSKSNGARNMDFVVYLNEWLKTRKNIIEPNTYEGYISQINSRIKEYFTLYPRTLQELTAQDINGFHAWVISLGCKGNTAIHFHALMRKALHDAVKQEILQTNVCDLANRPKKEPFHSEYYNEKELNELLLVSEEDSLSVVILLAAYYGLRRSEVLGLKWNAIDFKEKKIKICHKVIEHTVNGKKAVMGYDKTKTLSSNRTLPLIPSVEKALLEEKERQVYYKRVLRSAYSNEYAEYICVDKMGLLIKPDYVSEHFKKVLKKHNLKEIRFHDLRHSCASLLLANKVPMKQIQDWLGHSTFATTADTYSHLDFKSKEESAGVIGDILGK